MQRDPGYERPPAPPRRSGCLSTLLTVLLMAGGSAVVIALLALAGFWWAGDRFFDGLDTILNPPQPTPTVDVRSVVVRQVRGASELTTTIVSESAIIDSRKARTLFGFEVGSTRLLYIAWGEVRAGVDLSEIGVEDVSVVSDTIRLRLPPPRIQAAAIDVTRSGIYDFDQGIFGPDAPELQTLAERDALTEILVAACENGILEQANERAELTVSQLLGVAGYREVIVESRPPLPGSCALP